MESIIQLKFKMLAAWEPQMTASGQHSREGIQTSLGKRELVQT